jgi:hypothetical protein
MTDYPSTSPFGPHGPQVGANTVTPNPTMSSPEPAYQPSSWGAAPTTSYPASSGTYSGGGGSIAGSPVLSGRLFGKLLFNFAIGGAVLGALIGLGRGLMLHMPSAVTGMFVARFAIAGAAAGASVAPAVRAALLAFRALLWIGIVIVLWAIALGAVGLTGWLNRFH